MKKSLKYLRTVANPQLANSSWSTDPTFAEPRENHSGNLIIYVNGILTVPQRSYSWTERAERYTLIRSMHDCDSFEYFSYVLSDFLFDQKRIEEVIDLLIEYRTTFNYKVHLVGHSHGGDYVRKLVAQTQMPIESLHLISAATEADFNKNGLNKAFEEDRLKSLFVYRAGHEWILKASDLTRYCRNPIGLAGGNQMSDKATSLTINSYFPEYSHTSWWEPENFVGTMKAILSNIDLIPQLAQRMLKL